MKQPSGSSRAILAHGPATIAGPAHLSYDGAAASIPHSGAHGADLNGVTEKLLQLFAARLQPAVKIESVMCVEQPHANADPELVSQALNHVFESTVNALCRIPEVQSMPARLVVATAGPAHSNWVSFELAADQSEHAVPASENIVARACASVANNIWHQGLERAETILKTIGGQLHVDAHTTIAHGFRVRVLFPAIRGTAG